LNQAGTMNGQTGNQLSLLSAAGYFSTPITAPQTLPTFSRATDTSVSLEHRVRSFLAVNCVQCHQSGGGTPATWDARAWLSLEGTALINGIPNNNGGNPANKLLIPGDLTHSIVLQRLRANGFSRMPPLATAVIDEAATNLLHTWISTELTNRQSFAQWQLAIFGSTNTANALANADPDGDGANNYYEYVTHTSPTNAIPAPWTIAIDKAAGTVSVNFQRIANLGFIVETSTNFANWSVWDVPDNTPKFSATSFADTVSGPLSGGETNRFFRVKLVEP
jgi:mono/diheme cytochrome c family protein